MTRNQKRIPIFGRQPRDFRHAAAGRRVCAELAKLWIDGRTLGRQRPRLKPDANRKAIWKSPTRKNSYSKTTGLYRRRQKDGWPQMTFVTPGIDAEGRVIITSRGTTYKIKHFAPRPARVPVGLRRAIQRLEVRADPWHGGNHRAARRDGHFDLLVQAGRAASTRTGTSIKKQMADEKRVIIRVKMEKVGPQSLKRI